MHAIRQLGNKFGDYFIVVVLVFVTLSASSASRGADAEDTAKQRIERKQNVIAGLAHPTATLDKLEFVETRPSDKGGGFKLVYRLNFTSAFGNPFYSKLAFVFDEDGNYQEVETVSTSAAVNPFTAAGFAIEFIKGKIKENEDLKKDKQLMGLVEKAEVKGILKVMIKKD